MKEPEDTIIRNCAGIERILRSFFYQGYSIIEGKEKGEYVVLFRKVNPWRHGDIKKAIKAIIKNTPHDLHIHFGYEII